MTKTALNALANNSAPAPGPARVVVLKNLQQQTYDVLLERILRGEAGFTPGSRLNVPVLAEQLGISLTPIKESLRLLQAHGLIEMSPRRGTYVAELTATEFDEHIDVSRELEFAALRLSRGRLTPASLSALQLHVDNALRQLETGQVVESISSNQAFHQALVALATNHQLSLLYGSPRAYRLATVYRTDDLPTRRRLIDQHQGIVDALATPDIDFAMARIAAHWEETRHLGRLALAALTPRRSGD